MLQVKGFDELEPHFGSPSGTKKVTAFFKIARSLAQDPVLSSEPLQLLSARRLSGLRPGLRRCRPALAKWLRVGSETPSSRAIWVRARSLDLARRTASSRNSSGYGGLVFPNLDFPCDLQMVSG